LLEAIGYRSTEPIARLSDALAAAQRERFRGAVLDMNLNGEIVYPLAELLASQQVPFIFVTGYAPRSVDARFTTVPILQKPVLQDELAAVLDQVLSGPPRRAKAASGAAAR
jgi:two-component SAPR family response regulator